MDILSGIRRLLKVGARSDLYTANNDIKADYCLRAKGDGMLKSRIIDGDIVFVQKCDTVNNGDIAVVGIDNDIILARVYYQANNMCLCYDNPCYRTIVLVGEDMSRARILGRVVAFQSLVC